MEVPLERRSTPALGIARVDAGLLVVPIARVPRRAMLGPGAHANPAELIFAFLAGHVAVEKGWRDSLAPDEREAGGQDE